MPNLPHHLLPGNMHYQIRRRPWRPVRGRAIVRRRVLTINEIGLALAVGLLLISAAPDTTSCRMSLVGVFKDGAVRFTGCHSRGLTCFAWMSGIYPVLPVAQVIDLVLLAIRSCGLLFTGDFAKLSRNCPHNPPQLIHPLCLLAPTYCALIHLPT
jgi:hypothetical protein